MKKFWKNLCVGAMSIVSATSLTACKKDKEVNYDLDGDGVVSAWEEPFVNKGDANRVEAGFTAEQATFVDISNLQELKAINDRQNETNVYRLTQDIDCNGEEVCINLAGSNIYGNNKTISNFKFGNVATDAENKVIKCLFYNGIAVVDLICIWVFRKLKLKMFNRVLKLLLVQW